MKTFFSTALLAFALGGLFVTACSSSEATPATSSGDGGAPGSSSEPEDSGSGKADVEEPGDSGSACNTLVNEAPEATSSTVKGNAPKATGGTIADGKYFLTEFTLYDPSGSDSEPSLSGMKTTLSISGKVMSSIIDIGDGTDRTFSETFAVNGTKLDRTLTCPKSGPDLAAVYSVNGNTLTIYETDSSSGTVAGNVYEKQ